MSLSWIIGQVFVALFVVLLSVVYRTVIHEPRAFLNYVRDLSEIDPEGVPIALPPRFVPVYGDNLRHLENVKAGRPLAIVQEPASAGFKLSLAFFGREPRLYLHDGELAAKLLLQDMKDVGLDPFRKARFSVMYPKSLITATGRLWRIYRKLMRSITDTSRLKEYGKIIADLASDQVKLHEDAASQQVNFTALFKILAARVIGASAFGNGLDDQQAAVRVAEANTAMFGETAKYMNTIFAQIPALRSIPTTQRRRATNAAEECRGIAGNWIDDRRQGKSKSKIDGPDFADTAIAMMNAGEVTRKEVLDNSSLLVVAGHETTAYTMSWMAAIFAKYPAIYEQCRDEVRRVLGGARDFNELIDSNPDASRNIEDHFLYLRATMAEALRLFPPIVFIERLCKKEFQLSEKVTLRANTSVTVDVFGIQHDERLWPEPDEARPERHLDDAGNFVMPPASKFLAFSAGGRMCPGQLFARREILMVWSFILRNYDIEWAPEPNMDMHVGITIAPKNPIYGRVQPVEKQ